MPWMMKSALLILTLCVTGCASVLAPAHSEGIAGLTDEEVRASICAGWRPARPTLADIDVISDDFARETLANLQWGEAQGCW